MDKIRDADVAALRCFLAVVDQGGFTAAASHLNLTQSGVSVRIRRLEEMLGKQLLTRTSRRFDLTEHGKTVLGYARRMIEINDEMVSRLDNPGMAGELKVGLADYLAPLQLARILGRFRKSFPRVRLEVVTGIGRSMAPAYNNGELDLVIAGDAAGLEGGMPLFDEQLVWIGDAAAFDSVPESVPLVVLPPPCELRRAATETLDEAGIPWHVSLTAGSVAGLYVGMRAGLGISVLPAGAIAADLSPLDMPSVLHTLPTQRIYAYTTRRRNRLVQRFVEFVSDELLTGSSSRRPVPGQQAA